MIICSISFLFVFFWNEILPLITWQDLHNSKSAFERSRFNLVWWYSYDPLFMLILLISALQLVFLWFWEFQVNALTNIEAKKKFEFLESFSAIMDAHLRYFKLVSFFFLVICNNFSFILYSMWQIYLHMFRGMTYWAKWSLLFTRYIYHS